MNSKAPLNLSETRLTQSQAPEVFILGSGRSILDLTPEECDHINRAQCVLAMNKFMAFHHLTPLKPTHIYFVDFHENSLRFMQYMFHVCRRNRIKGLTLVLLERYCHRTTKSWIDWCLKRLAVNVLRKKERWFFLTPRQCRTQFVKTNLKLDNQAWAESLDQPLFHFRTSLVSALNYLTIMYPGSVIKMVGVDFDSPDYFFQEELNQLNITWKDHTFERSKKENTYFLNLEHQGGTVFDRFDFVVRHVVAHGNRLYSCNANNPFVTRGFVPHCSVMAPASLQQSTDSFEGQT